MTKKEILLNRITDIVSKLMYYDRKEDEELKRGDIEKMIQYGEITVDEIVEKFKQELKDSL